MGEKGLAAQEKLPPGYVMPAPGSNAPGRLTHERIVRPGEAFPTGRPGDSINWDEQHQAWTPPGFQVDPADADRAFNPQTGQNAVWDGERSSWIDAQSGQAVSYEP